MNIIYIVCTKRDTKIINEKKYNECRCHGEEMRQNERRNENEMTKDKKIIIYVDM